MSQIDLLMEAEKRGLPIPPDKKALLDEARKRNLVPSAVPKAMPNLEPPPAKTRLQLQAENAGVLQSMAVGAGKGMLDIGRGLGIVDQPSEFEASAYKDLEDKNPIATTVGEVAGQSAPFLLPGVGVTAIPAAGARVAATAALGAAEGGLITRGQGGSSGQQLMGAGVGGTVAGLAELVLPRVIRAGSKLIRKALGREVTGAVVDKAGQPSAEFLEALKKSGIEFGDLVDAEVKALAGQPVDAAQAGRKAFLKSKGLNPTHAEMTREAVDFQAQQEAAKTSGRVRTAMEGNEAILSGQFDDAVTGTGGQVVTPTSTVTDVVVNKATELDSQISNLYKLARESAPGEKNVSLDMLTKILRDSAGKNAATGGAVSAISSDLKSRGVLTGRRMMMTGRIDVETAEEVRKLMNQLYDPQQPFRNIVLRDLKNALDDDVFRASGGDSFKTARQAKALYETELKRAGVSKFDNRKQNLVRDVLENKIDPDQFTDKVVFSKVWRAADLKQLKSYVSTSEAGKSAWSDLRADALQKIKDIAFIGPEDAMGNKAMTRAALERAMNKIGPQKMAVLFEPAEVKFLNDMAKVSRLREPVRATAIGKGPTAQAVGQLMSDMRQAPLLKAAFDLVTMEQAGRVVIAASPKEIVKPLTRLPSQVAAGVGVAAAGQGNE